MWTRILLYGLIAELAIFIVFIYNSGKLRWPNTVFARALTDAIQHVHKDCKNKHAVDTAIIFCAQCPLYVKVLLEQC